MDPDLDPEVFMRNRELRRVEQRWERPDLFSQRRRRFNWWWVLAALVLAVLAYILAQADLEGIWGSIQTRSPASEATGESARDPSRLPLPPLPGG